MSVAEQVSADTSGRLYTFDDVKTDVLVVGIGDTVEVPDFDRQFDPLVVSLVNAHVSGSHEGSRVIPSREFYSDPNCPRPLGTFAVQQSRGTNVRGVQLYPYWPSDTRLPSVVLRGRNKLGRIVNASVTLLDIPAEEPPLRRIDLLLQGILVMPRSDPRHPIVRLQAQKGGTNRLKTYPTSASEEEAAHLVASALLKRST